jgi:hypothetical protein
MKLIKALHSHGFINRNLIRLIVCRPDLWNDKEGSERFARQLATVRRMVENSRGIA